MTDLIQGTYHLRILSLYFSVQDASSRRINLPRSGKLVVGAGINTSANPMRVDSDSGLMSPTTFVKLHNFHNQLHHNFTTYVLIA